MSDLERPSRKPPRSAYALCCAAVIASGLALRTYGYRLGLPFEVVKYGGSVLWGSLVYFLVAVLAPTRAARHRVCVAAGITISVELFRLVHTPWLDAFRLTTAGAWLLGRVFSPWNIVAYLSGIALAATMAKRLRIRLELPAPH
jgi:Protein of unknown function (DUF2809)